MDERMNDIRQMNDIRRMNDAQWVLQCKAVVEGELRVRGWTLVPHETLLPNVISELRSRFDEPATLSSAAVRRATVRCYARVLFETCGKDGTSEQQRAFEELWDYLYPRALYRVHNPSSAQDASQQALVKIFRKRSTCREPGSFLRWTEQVLIHEIFERFRKEYERRLTERGIEYVAHEMSLEELGKAANEELNQSEEILADPKQDTPEQAFTGPMRDALVAALRVCLENERQVQVLVELFFDDKSFLEVAELLQTTPLNVQVIRSRAIKKLRDCPAMQQLVEDWEL